MKEILYDVLSYIIEYAKLIPLVLLFFGTEYISLQNIALTSAASLILIGAGAAAGLTGGNTLFISLTLMLNAFLIIKRKKNLFFVFVCYVYICILDMIINGFIMYIAGLEASDIDHYTPTYLLLNMPSLIIIFTAILIKYKKRRSMAYQFSKSYIALFALGGLAVTFYLTSIQMFAFSEKAVIYSKLAALALGICSGVFVAVISLLIVTKSHNESLQKENAAVNSMLTMMEEYYLMLLKKDEETKAFRHDFRSHLYCMQNFCHAGKYDEFEKYLSDMAIEFGEIKKGTDTGNDLVNAILNDISCRFPDISFSWTGHIPNKLELSSFSLCTIFSNVLKNAFEAAEKSSTKYIEVVAKTSGQNIFIEISNTSDSAPVTDGKRYISFKTGGTHGYGIRNVQECMERIGGQFSLSYSAGIAHTELILPGVIPEDVLAS